MPSTYGKTWWREGYACGCMIQSIEDVIEPRLRAAGYLSSSGTVDIYQQAYNSSVSASAGTHGGGGALDHRKGNDGETKIWRECGVADWQRGPDEDYSFDDHNHGIWQGCPHLSGDAEGQLDQYDAGCNGLADWGPDQSPNVAPITWQAAYDKYSSGGADQDKGVLGMSEYKSFYTAKDQKVAADDEWHQVKLNDDGDTSLAFSPCTFSVVASVSMSSADVPKASFRYGVADGDTGKVETWYPSCRPGAGTPIAWVGSLGGDKNENRLRLFVHADTELTISAVTAKTIYG